MVSLTNVHPPEGDESNEALVELVRDEIARSGPLTFARYMELVVAHPEFGYYASSANRVGRSGDFLTAPETHYLFGWLVARQIFECWERLGRPAKLTVAEDGGGRGTLGLQVLDWFSRNPPTELKQLGYQLDDVNPNHRERIEQVIEDFGDDGQVSVSRSTSGALTGVILANELLDALPFHRLVYDGGNIRELYVTFEDGWFVDEVGEVSSGASEVLGRDVSLREGQIFEYSPAIERWIRDIARRLERGYVLVFDYGDERERLLDVDRFPRGTMKTYRRHQVGEDPFHDLGLRDITAHVDMSHVTDAAERSGLQIEGLTSQAEFVAGVGLDEVLLGIQADLKTVADYPAARAAAMELLNPGSLGRFRVAILSRNVEQSSSLRGLAFRMPGFIHS